MILYLYCFNYCSLGSILNKSYGLLAYVPQLVPMLGRNSPHCNEVMTYCNTIAGLHIFVINKLIFRQTTFIVY